MAKFEIGEEVVCIGTFTKVAMDYRHNHKFPKKNEIYKIRNLQSFPDTPEIFIRLQQVVNPLLNIVDGRKLEICFSHHKFRRLDYQFVEQTLKRIKDEVLTPAELN